MARRPEPELKPLDKNSTLADRAYLALRQALTTGQFAPGEKLTIRDVAAMLDISMTPAKDAMGRLIAEKILRSGPQRAAVVPILSETEVRDLYIARISLEAAITEKAVLTLTDRQIKQLETVQHELDAASERNDYKQLLWNNERFHFGLYEAAALPETLDLIRGLWMRLGPHLNIIFSTHAPRRKFPGHLAVLKALRERKPSAAGAAIRDDLERGCERMCQMIADKQADPQPRGMRRTLQPMPAVG